ncbi:hypothetical protein JOF48_002999 [Arthrobacter stackebrandtii]|uniref:Uncharacterized protein n=1 Tax=Arthrobacter stackebrandtii TaxID=272161 RepID=A0ABS4Z0H8_9MICC|nr:hypothetical protein [Arthrobacter stackebrandtii]MBP2414200.1 hypothetical protein [Arthrobacter stackebrandtii]PYG98935.1 hypothetical protein CVV67_17845 [Arthrobacter stackebrandtii]
MRKTTKMFASLALAAILGTSMAACSSTPEENTTSACDSYTTFVNAVGDVNTALTSGSTIGDIRDARDKAASAYEELNKNLDEVSQDRVDALDAAWEGLDKAVTGLDKDMTIPEAKDALTGNVSKLASAQSELNADLKC